jgi:hypothetical protein
MTEPIHAELARRGVLPAEHYLDSGYPSADLLVSSRADYGIALVTPMLADTSPQAPPAAATTAPRSPSTSTTSRSPAHKGGPAPHGPPQPSAAPK